MKNHLVFFVADIFSGFLFSDREEQENGRRSRIRRNDIRNFQALVLACFSGTIFEILVKFS